jgi:hypothetical protein
MPLKLVSCRLSQISIKPEESEVSIEGKDVAQFSLDSALARQIFYTTTRLGIYRTLT